MIADYIPRLRHAAFAIWARNMLVWRKMIGSSVVTNFVLVALLLIISHRSTAGNTPSARRRRQAEAAAERELEAS